MVFATETCYVIWDDVGGSIEVRDDADGLDMIDLRAKDEIGKEFARLSFTRDQAKLVLEALGNKLKEEPRP